MLTVTPRKEGGKNKNKTKNGEDRTNKTKNKIVYFDISVIVLNVKWSKYTSTRQLLTVWIINCFPTIYFVQRNSLYI